MFEDKSYSGDVYEKIDLGFRERFGGTFVQYHNKR